MNRFLKAGVCLALCMIMALNSKYIANAQEISEADATTEYQTTEEEKVTTEVTTEQKKESTTQSESKVTTETKTTERKKHSANIASSKKVKTKKVKIKEDNKKVKKVIPRIYNDTRLKMKDHKEYINGFVYFNQADQAWNENGYQIRSSGCGPTAMAVCISSLTGKWITPLDTTIWAYKHGYYSGDGAVHEMVPQMAEEYKLKCKGLGTDYEAIRKALLKKHPVVALMGPGYFTNNGHFIVLVGIDKNDQVTVADVGSRQRCNYKYPLKSIIKQAKEASAGGPFWKIFKQVKHKKKIPEQPSKEFIFLYNDMKSVLQKNYQLVVPLKKGKLVQEDQFVTVSSLDINDKVIVCDSHNGIKFDVGLKNVIEEVKKEAINCSFSKTVTIEPNKMNRMK